MKNFNDDNSMPWDTVEHEGHVLDLAPLTFGQCRSYVEGVGCKALLDAGVPRGTVAEMVMYNYPRTSEGAVERLLAGRSVWLNEPGGILR